MVSFDTDKVAVLEPKWADFRGFSFLFDPEPASECLVPFGSSLLKIASPVRSGLHPNLQFLRLLRGSLDDELETHLRNEHLFCPLPRASYHITAWDGVNRDNLSNLAQSAREEWEPFLSRLPGSLQTGWPQGYPLTFGAPAATVRFGFSGLTRWKTVLVARLDAVDPDSQAALARIAEAREALDGAWQAYGKPPGYPYVPHVSLGYFVNADLAEAAEPLIRQWQERIAKILASAVLEYRSIGLYAYLDMTRYIRREL